QLSGGRAASASERVSRPRLTAAGGQGLKAQRRGEVRRCAPSDPRRNWRCLSFPGGRAASASERVSRPRLAAAGGQGLKSAATEGGRGGPGSQPGGGLALVELLWRRLWKAHSSLAVVEEAVPEEGRQARL